MLAMIRYLYHWATAASLGGGEGLPPISREDLLLDDYLEYSHTVKTLYIYEHPCLLCDSNPGPTPRGCGYKLMTGVLWVRAMVPLKTRRLQGLMHVTSVEAQSPPVGVVGRAANPFVSSVEEEEKWEDPDRPQGVLPKNWGETVQNLTVTCMRATVPQWSKYYINARHVMSSSPVPLKIRRVGQRCTLNLSRAETSSRCCGS
ncbi:hypothetical protein TNCV_94311 [Trichonephila clavipes]|nr:hypothetical protein TNCV_94311 [Trichonephila clavipes]